MDETDSDEWALDPIRTALFLWLAEQKGKLYVWGAKGPDYWDCSGLVTGSFHELGLGDVRATHSAARLYDELEHVEYKRAQPGDLIFYGPPDRVTHVVFLWNDGRVYGAGGGDSSTTTPEAAMRRRGACVKFKDSHMYRPDLRGVRRYPTGGFPPKKEHTNA